MPGIKLSPKQRSALAQALLEKGMTPYQSHTSPYQTLGRLAQTLAGAYQMKNANQQSQQEQAQLSEALANAASVQGGNPAMMQQQVALPPGADGSPVSGRMTMNSPLPAAGESDLQNQQLAQGGPLAQSIMSQLNLGRIQAKDTARAEAAKASRDLQVDDYKSERDAREAQNLKRLEAQLRDQKDTWTQLDPSEFTENKLPANTLFAQRNSRGEIKAKFDTGLELEIGPDGTVRMTSGSGSRRTDSNTIKLQESYNFYNSAVNDLDDIIGKIQADPTLVGVPGAIRKAGQSIFGIGKDISRVLGVDSMRKVIGEVQSNITDEAFEDPEQKAKFFDDPNLSTMRLFENTIGFMLARERQQSGRLLASTIEQAMKDARLTGLTSSTDAFNRLQMVREMMARRRNNTLKMMTGGGGTTSREVYNETTGKFEVVQD